MIQRLFFDWRLAVELRKVPMLWRNVKRVNIKLNWKNFLIYASITAIRTGIAQIGITALIRRFSILVFTIALFIRNWRYYFFEQGATIRSAGESPTRPTTGQYSADAFPCHWWSSGDWNLYAGSLASLSQRVLASREALALDAIYRLLTGQLRRSHCLSPQIEEFSDSGVISWTNYR